MATIGGHLSAWDRGPSHSARVHPGPDGRLLYPADEQGDVIPDFSTVGYKGGGVPLPTVPVVTTLQPSAAPEDDAPRIQAAIDALAAQPPGADGIRGALLLERGEYRLGSSLLVSASGIVLRGEGDGPEGTRLRGVGPFTSGEPLTDGDKPAAGGAPPNKANPELQSGALVEFVGPSGVVEVGNPTPIVGNCAVGAKEVRVSSGSFAVGTKILVKRFGNRAWLDTLRLPHVADPMVHAAERCVLAVRADGDTDVLTLDHSLVVAVEERWGGGEVIEYTDDGRLTQVAVENLSGDSAFDETKTTTLFTNMDRPNRVTEAPDGGDREGSHYHGFEYYNDEDHWWNFVRMSNCRDSWVQGVSGQHFVSSIVRLDGGTIACTVQDCRASEFVGMISGSREPQDPNP